MPPAGLPWWKDGRTWLLLAITLLALVVGWQWKSVCHDPDWNTWDNGQWRNLCYSDVQALYGSRGAADGMWPYTQTFNEYPPLTGLFMHVMGELSGGQVPAQDVPAARNQYLLLSALAFGALALLTTVLLGELVGRDRRVLYWAAAPALVVYAFYNWDLLAIAPAVGALLAFRRGHYGVAGALLGLGASAKLYPAFLAPALGLWILREERGLRRGGWAFGLGFVAAWLAVHLPFALLDWHGLLEAYTFQAKRAPNFETVWYALGHLGRTYDNGFLASFNDEPLYSPGGLLPLVAAFGLSGWAAYTRRLDPIAAAAIPVFVFLALNKVYSIQYTLWVIPLLVLVPVPRTLKALAVVADLAVLVTLANYFALWDKVQDGNLYTPVAAAVLFRAGVWIACAYTLARPAFPRRAPPAPIAPEAAA